MSSKMVYIKILNFILTVITMHWNVLNFYDFNQQPLQGKAILPMNFFCYVNRFLPTKDFIGNVIEHKKKS